MFLLSSIEKNFISVAYIWLISAWKYDVQLSIFQCLFILNSDHLQVVFQVLDHVTTRNVSNWQIGKRLKALPLNYFLQESKLTRVKKLTQKVAISQPVLTRNIGCSQANSLFQI